MPILNGHDTKATSLKYHDTYVLILKYRDTYQRLPLKYQTDTVLDTPERVASTQISKHIKQTQSKRKMTKTTTNPVVVDDFLQYLSDTDVAVAVAVIKALTGVIYRSEASTMMQMESELQEAALHLKSYQPDDACALSTRYQNSIATTAGCQLFLRYVTRCFLEFDVRASYTAILWRCVCGLDTECHELLTNMGTLCSLMVGTTTQDFELCKSQLIDRGNFFAETSLSSRKRIAEVGHSFVRDGMVRSLSHMSSQSAYCLSVVKLTQ